LNERFQLLVLDLLLSFLKFADVLLVAFEHQRPRRRSP
jgi:hypothetical protein